MRIRLLLGSLIVLAAATHARAQILYTDSQIVIGDDVLSKGSRIPYSQGSHLAFEAAMTTLETAGLKGGTIEVLPGTYVFDATVDVNVPGVRILGGPNARIVAGPGLSGPCFRIAAAAEDTLIEGLTLEDKRDPAPAGVTLLDVRADRFSLLHCRLLRANLEPPTARSIGVKLGDAGSGGVQGTLLQGNRFVVGQLGDGAGVPTIGEADGVCLLTSVGGRGLRLQGNSFESALAKEAAPIAFLEAAVSLENELGALVTGNSISLLGARVAGSTTPADLIESYTTADPGIGTRMTFRGNYAERLVCNSILRVVGVSSAPAPVVISGNDFGRVSGIVDGAVYLEHADGSLIGANGFHNVGQDAQVSPAVRVTHSDGVSLLGNAFSVPKHRHVWLSTCDGALIAGNQFEETPTQPSDAYLHLDDVLDASIVQNRFSTAHCPAISMSSSASASVFLCGNVLPPGCGPSSEPWTNSNYTILQCDSAGFQGNPIF